VEDLAPSGRCWATREAQTSWSMSPLPTRGWWSWRPEVSAILAVPSVPAERMTVEWEELMWWMDPLVVERMVMDLTL
jgi:hypothetical protein